MGPHSQVSLRARRPPSLPPNNKKELREGSGTSDAPTRAGGAGFPISCDHLPVNVHVSPRGSSPLPPKRRINLPAGSAAIAAEKRPGGDESNEIRDQFMPSQAQVTSEPPPPIVKGEPPNKINLPKAAL